MAFGTGFESTEDLKYVWDDRRCLRGGGKVKEPAEGTTANEMLIARMGVAARACN